MNEVRLKSLKRNSSLPAFHNAVKELLVQAERAMQITYTIGSNERGDWAHYYYCSHDAARLQFDWNEPKHHLCPACHTVWKGEPYDSAWVSMAHASIGGGLYSLGLASLLKNDTAYAERVKSFLAAYAMHYEGYPIHGTIPYNGPGKLFAQTLDEAHWIIDLCMAYDMIVNQLTDTEKFRIHDGLFRPCAQFLIEHKEHQLHNHAVLITAAIASLGFLLGDESIMRAGLDGEYGLLDQIERGVLADGLWYEGAFQYHYYAFHPILQYFMIVEGTPWDLHANPKVKSMFDFPLECLLPDGSFPSLNDASSKAGIHSYAHYYEIALAWFGDNRYRELLRLAYGMGNKDPEHVPSRMKTVQRSSAYALLFGELLESTEQAPAPIHERTLLSSMSSHFSSGISGLTKLVNRKHWHLTVKHSLFGGEHDHMDRLGISFGKGHIPFFVDPGTTAYAVPAHYAWFKHTYSHNTLCVDGKDQPPADARKIVFGEEAWGAWVESAVDWHEDRFYLKDKILLPAEMCPWDDEAYRHTEVRRMNVLTEHFLLDIVKVKVPQMREIDLLFHMNGQSSDVSGWESAEDALSALSQDLFHAKRKKAFRTVERLSWHMHEGILEQTAWCSKEGSLYTARTLDNPPNAYRQTLIQRTKLSGEAVFINAFTYSEVKRNSPIDLEVWNKGDGSYALKLTLDGTDYRVSFDWGSKAATVQLESS